jgi:hypothetical protein
MNHMHKLIAVAAGLLMVLAALSGGCPNDLIANLIEEQTGQVSVVIINNTDYRASFTLGGYDAFALNPPVAPQLEQRRLEANSTTTPISPTCARNIAIGTAELIERAIETEANLEDGFDDDAFSESVNFSSAPIGDPAAALPTIGTAEGREVRLGVDYACGDRLIFTFVQDATAAGGFRIEYSLLQTGEDE